jgi:hypothetical protein
MTTRRTANLLILMVSGIEEYHETRTLLQTAVRDRVTEEMC